MRLVILAAAGLALSSGIAFAGEGAGGRFEYSTPGTSTLTSSTTRLPAKGQDPFPFRAMDHRVTSSPFALVPSERSEAVVQTSNALPSALVFVHMAGHDRTTMPQG